MSGLVMIFAMIVGAVAQAALPSPPWLGHASFPVLLGLVLYYALLGTRGQTIACALFTGLISDALELVPLGYSSFIHLLAGLTVRHVRDIMMTRQWSTHALLGGLAHAAGTLLCFLLLLQSNRPELSPVAALARTAGAILTGGVAVPVVFALLQRLERVLGHRELREAA